MGLISEQQTKTGAVEIALSTKPRMGNSYLRGVYYMRTNTSAITVSVYIQAHQGKKYPINAKVMGTGTYWFFDIDVALCAQDMVVVETVGAASGEVHTARVVIDKL